MIKSIFVNLLYKFKRIVLNRKWRLMNSHNFTKLDCHPEDPRFFDHVTIGKNCYGPVNAIYSGNINEKLIIGSYCSIGNGTTFFLGSEHNYKTFSTYPFNVKLLNAPYEASSKGPIIVEDDVWFGQNVMVLSGVRIGKGSVIANSSIVVKDVEPYSIIGGNPAKLIKKRFSDKIISKLMKLDFNKINKEKLKIYNKEFYSELNEENVIDLIKIINDK